MWHPIVIGLGALTMLVGGWRALRQYDLKLLLAYGTVSQLGFLVMVTGFGTRDAALAGVALLLAHALFKAALFLVVGIIDHAAGTRDWRRLSGLGRRMPVVATIAFVAAASMAGVPPLLGFVAKEAVFTAFLERDRGGRAVGVGRARRARSSARCSPSRTARDSCGARSSREPDVEATPAASRGRTSSRPRPALLSAASVVFAFAVPFIEPLLAAYADTLPGSQEYHLALWHGLEPALAVSAAVFALGGGARLGPPAGRAHAGRDRRRRSMRHAATSASSRSSTASPRAVTTAIQRARLPGYLAIIMAVFIGGLGSAALMNQTWPDGVRLWDYPAQPFIALVMVIAAIAAATVRQRITAVLLVSVTGYGLVLLFGMSGAPDLALTQALVETLTLVVFVLVLRRLPKQIARRNPPCTRRVTRAIIGVLAGLVMARGRPRRARRAHRADHRRRTARTRDRGARHEHRERHARRHPRLGHPGRDLGARRRGHRRREPDLRVGPHGRRTSARRAARPAQPPAARARARVEHARAATRLADVDDETDAAAEGT